MKSQKVTLYFKDDRSDKVYVVWIAPTLGDPTKFTVEAAYGRRGGTLQAQTKTKPVTSAEAESALKKIVAEKTSKGYTTGQPAQTTVVKKTLYRPMLLNPITRKRALELVADDAWMLENKWDGIRVILSKTGDAISATSRTGKPVSLPFVVISAAKSIPNDFVLDGELVDGVFVAFDLLKNGVTDFCTTPAKDRIAALATLLSPIRSGLLASPVALTKREKKLALAKLEAIGAEGVVFKRKSANYTPDRPHREGDALKFKFWNTASVIVTGRHIKKGVEKRSVSVALYDGRDLGCVTIAPNQTVPPVGAVIECKYLYVHDVGGKLIQPNFIRVRVDVAPEDCTVELQDLQIKGAKRS